MWIEIHQLTCTYRWRWSLSARRVWIEILSPPNFAHTFSSLSARRVWIEIKLLYPACNLPTVTLCEESVDWNLCWLLWCLHYLVTLCEESVDWNASHCNCVNCFEVSLSARRVWIEIMIRLIKSVIPWSLSARRVWIEILASWLSLHWTACHSLRGECGLKSTLLSWYLLQTCHSLRGECGLKCIPTSADSVYNCHSLRGECGLKFCQPIQQCNPV